jgi:hypothetical protein
MSATASARVLRPARAVSTRAVYWHGAVGLVALVSALLEFRVLRLGGFALDDFRDLGQARTGLNVHLLLAPIGGAHFQPVTRFLDWLIATPFHTSYTAAATVLSVLYGLGTYWLVRLLDTLWGPRLLHLVIGFLFGTSCVLIGASQWVAAASTSSVAVYFAAGACLGFFRWLSTGSRTSYALALAALALAVGSWEEALATPALITVIWICFARGWQPVRRALLGQFPFYAIALAYVVYVQLQPWHQGLNFPTVGYWLLLLVTMVGRTLAASVIGTTPPSGAQTAFDWFSALIVDVAVVVGALWLARRRRLDWLALVVFGVGTLLVSIPVAATRAFLPAGVVATTPRYVTFLPLFFAIAIAGAVRRRPGREPRPSHDYAPRSEGRAERDDDNRAGWPSKTIVWVPVALAVCVGYLINLSHTFGPSQFSIQMGRSGSAHADRIGSGITTLGRTGQRSLVDSVVPFPVWYSTTDGSSRLSVLMPYWSSAARTFGEGHIAGIDQTGAVRWASFHAGGAGTQYVRLVVRTPIRTTMLVRIAAIRPTQPETPWRISLTPGTHSLTLAAWSSAVRTVNVTGRQVRVVGIRTGTITLGPPVTGELP